MPRKGTTINLSISGPLEGKLIEFAEKQKINMEANGWRQWIIRLAVTHMLFDEYYTLCDLWDQME
jgi:hypothetical protein